MKRKIHYIVVYYLAFIASFSKAEAMEIAKSFKGENTRNVYHKDKIRTMYQGAKDDDDKFDALLHLGDYIFHRLKEDGVTAKMLYEYLIYVKNAPNNWNVYGEKIVEYLIEADSVPDKELTTLAKKIFTLQRHSCYF